VTALLAWAVLLPAATIVFEGAPTGVNDGKDYVLPYQVSIDGAMQLVDCIDFADSVSLNDTYVASVLTLEQAATSGFFSTGGGVGGYERVAWLSAQSYSGDAQQIGLQYAIWNVFGSAAQTADAVMYENAADEAAAGGYAGFDFSTFRFIQQAGAVSGQSGTEQAFVFSTPNSPASPFNQQNAPEPVTIWLLGVASGFVGLYAYSRGAWCCKPFAGRAKRAG
jgi:hypothetical protein